MGYTSNTNIELIPYDPGDVGKITLDEVIKKNAIVIYDSGSSGLSIQAFEGLYIKQTDLVPKFVYFSGGKGGGGEGEIVQPISDLLLNPESSLYLPVIIINGFITKIAIDGTTKVLKILFNRFKSMHRKKRIRMMYYSEEGSSFFEFPSETDTKEFEMGLHDIPKVMKTSLKGKYFTRSLKYESWIEEDTE